jgi:hypothetical protein
VANTPAEEKNLAVVEGNLVVVRFLVVEVGNLLLMHIPVVDIPVVVLTAQSCRIAGVRVDQDLPHFSLLVAVQTKVLLLVAAPVVVFLLVVRTAIPHCS